MRIRWSWLLLAALGAAALGWVLAPVRGALSDDEATAYCDELERMQDA
jgi:hypothetical protein